jgi:hypothetical protein
MSVSREFYVTCVLNCGIKSFSVYCDMGLSFCPWRLSICFACIGHSPLAQLCHQQFHVTNSDGAAAHILVRNIIQIVHFPD